VRDNLGMAGCDRCGAEIPRDAHFCPSCGAPVTAERPTEERKLATLLFADLVGSTALAGSQDPERTRVLLDRFYGAMTEEIERAGGTIEKFAGDAVMAAFGAPSALEDHAERALHAALAMQRRLAELFEGEVELRIGVNTGDVVVGQARAGSSFVSGDAVNVAARLEQAADPGAILVGERTVAAARGAFEFGASETVEAKGKPQGVECRRVVRALSLMRPRGVGGLRRTFVGREQEMGLLERVYAETCEQRKAQLVTILGDAGVGKTSLVREFWDRLGAEAPETVRRTGRCLSYGRGITYWPLGEVLKEHLGILESDPANVALERLGSREILGMTLGLDVARGLHPLARRDRFQDAWVGFLEELVGDQSAVILIEDVHWAEEQLLDLLERLVRDTRGPLLLVTTARPELLEQRPGWGARVPGTTVVLEALSPVDAARMLDELLGGSLPGVLRKLVVERAEGNPFFVEELLATLIDRELLQRQNGSWRLIDLPDDFAVPDTVHTVVAARIDLLEADEKQALQAASVIGRIFWAGPVYELVGDIEPDLRVLEDRDFIRRRPRSSIAGDREYAIKHAVTREVAYASLPKARRARLHAAFAQWLERTGEGLDEYAPLLAHHYAEAVRPDDADLAWGGDETDLAEVRARAHAWLRRAAELAINRFEIDDALALLHRALGLDPARDEAAALWREVGRANVLKFDGEAFWTAMQTSLEGTSDRAIAADTYSELAFQTARRAGMWKRKPPQELIEGWIEHAIELSDPETSARARALIARATLDPEQFGEAARQASELADRLGDVDLSSWAWCVRSEAAGARGDYDEGLAWTRRRLDAISQVTDPDHIAWIYFDGAWSTSWSGQFGEARAYAQSHDQVTARLTPHHRLHGVALLIQVGTRSGDWENVRGLGARAKQAVEANIATPCVFNVGALLECALANVVLGDEKEAGRLEQHAEALGMEGYSYFLEPTYIELALARGDLADAQRRLSKWNPKGFSDVDGLIARLNALVALGHNAEVEREAPALLKPGTYLEPFALRALGSVRGDEKLIEQAVARFQEFGLDWHATETKRALVTTLE
jgi:class 3 adenylate cyclase